MLVHDALRKTLDRLCTCAATTLDPARASMHQSQGTAVLSKVHARTVVPVTAASALPGSHFASPTASMLHGSLGGILSSVTQAVRLLGVCVMCITTAALLCIVYYCN